jgi:aspartate/glutamate racemase
MNRVKAHVLGILGGSSTRKTKEFYQQSNIHPPVSEGLDHQKCRYSFQTNQELQDRRTSGVFRNFHRMSAHAPRKQWILEGPGSK